MINSQQFKGICYNLYVIILFNCLPNFGIDGNPYSSWMLRGFRVYFYVYCELMLYVIAYSNLRGWRFEWLRPEKSTEVRHICIVAWTRGNKLWWREGWHKCCYIFLPLCVITAVLKAVLWTCLCCVRNISCIVSCQVSMRVIHLFLQCTVRLALQRSGSRHNRKSEMFIYEILLLCDWNWVIVFRIFCTVTFVFWELIWIEIFILYNAVLLYLVVNSFW